MQDDARSAADARRRRARSVDTGSAVPPEDSAPDVAPTRTQSVLAWLVVAGIGVALIAFCVVNFAPLVVAGWVGEQTEAWYLVVLVAGAVALASAGALIFLRGRRRP